jgi:DNA-directed RNA polymerase subunit RPC12/RpoP
LQSAAHLGILWSEMLMKSQSTGQLSSPGIVITPRDILFECPKCGKSLAVDQDAEGLIVPCQQCGADVIVPPKPSAVPVSLQPRHAPTAASPPPARTEVAPQIAQIQTQHVETADLKDRLAALSTQLKELQNRHADLIAKMMGHIDEVNHILEQLGGLQGAENEAHLEWNRIVEEITTAKQTSEKK